MPEHAVCKDNNSLCIMVEIPDVLCIERSLSYCITTQAGVITIRHTQNSICICLYLFNLSINSIIIFN